MARRLSPEIIWCGNLKPAAYPARWTRMRTGTPYGIFLHGGDLLILRRQIQRSLVKRRTARALLGSAAVLVGNSGWTADLARELLQELAVDGGADLVRVVPLGTDPVTFRPGIDTTAVRRSYGLDQRRWLISVARLTRHKGIDTALQVLQKLSPAYPNLGYIVVGSGDYQQNLERLAGSLAVANRVRFLTQVPDADLPALYNCAELYLGLSRQLEERVEGFGISLVEASSCGIPVVAGRSGGVSEAVRDGVTGLLVDPESPEEACAAVRRLLADPDLSSRLGSAGRRAAESYYNWDRVASDVAEISRELGRSVRPPCLPDAR